MWIYPEEHASLLRLLNRLMLAGRQAFVPGGEMLPEDIGNTEPPARSRQSCSSGLRSRIAQHSRQCLPHGQGLGHID